MPAAAVVSAGEALAAAVVSAGEAVAADVESDGEEDGEADGPGDGEEVGGALVGVLVGVGEAGGVAEGVDVGSSAIAGVPSKDAVKATARSGGAKKRCICKAPEKTAPQPSETGHKPPQQAGEYPRREASDGSGSASSFACEPALPSDSRAARATAGIRL